MTNATRTRGALGVVEQWLTAVNAGDGARVESLSHEQVDIVGPRGRGSAPRAVLSEWLARSGFSSQPVRWFCGGDGLVVVEQDATWHDPATGEPQDSFRIGSLFRVEDGRVARYERFDDGVAGALAAAGLDAARDEVTRPVSP
ncbi:nuclear transport factor 2 family protein [Actinoplanes sp. NPDC048791]|uniref:nuclear transport factor 2 family protein n=1 Tax=Actinoplanes sp. NPDC048791 TaxID=3154623 RepID=UPI0033C6B895